MKNDIFLYGQLLTSLSHLIWWCCLEYNTLCNFLQMRESINMNINMSKIVDVQAFHQTVAFYKSTKFTADPKSTHPSCQHSFIHWFMYQILPKTRAKYPKKRILKDFRRKTMTETSSADISIYLSSCDTFLNIPIEKWAESQHNLMNSNGWCPECQWFQSFLLLPIYIFHMGP